MNRLVFLLLAGRLAAGRLFAQSNGSGFSGNQIKTAAIPVTVPAGITLLARAADGSFYPVTLGMGLVWKATATGMTLESNSVIKIMAPDPKVEIARPSVSLATFTLAAAPSPGTLRVWWNGQLLTEPDQYTLAGAIITFTKQPEAGAIVRTEYY